MDCKDSPRLVMGGHRFDCSIVQLAHLLERAGYVEFAKGLFGKGNTPGGVGNSIHVVKYLQRLHSVYKSVDFSPFHFFDDLPSSRVVSEDVLGAVDVISEDEIVLPVDPQVLVRFYGSKFFSEQT